MNTTAEVDSGHSPRIPTSMPVPAVPRRTGPPRKKSSKSTAPPPEPPKEEVKAEPDADLRESTSVLLREDPESTLGTSSPTTKGSSVKVEALARDLEDSPALHDSEALEKHEIAKSSSDTHSLVLQQTDLPPGHALETPRAIEAVDEVALHDSSSLSAIPLAQPEIVDVAEGASAEDGVTDKDPNAESLGGIDLTPQPGLSSSLHSEPSKSVREDFLHGN